MLAELARTWLAGLPDPAVGALRRTRTVVLWLLEPLDRVLRWGRRPPGRSPSPPLWLRRHAGPIKDFDRAAAELSSTVAALGLLREGDVVLDVGCGCGSMALEFRQALGAQGRYVGFDVHGPSIAWCRTHFARDPRFRFELAPLDTAWSRGGGEASAYRFPAADGSVDFVLAKSVFTHLLEPDARHYLQEVRRVLRGGRHALLTVFLLPDDRGPSAVRPSFPYGGPDFWWRVRSRPTAGVAYSLPHFLDLLRQAELRVDHLSRGYWAGDRTAPTLQDVIVLS